ncbi:MAG: hypothetical protein WBA25_00680 [Jannaschia sp.]
MFRRFRRLSVAALLTMFVLSALTRIVSASLGTLPAEDSPAEPSRAELLCPPSREVADLLRQIAGRSSELDAREGAVALREQDMRVARQEVLASLETLAEAENALEARMYQSNRASEDDLAKLTSVYEGMKPKEAAILFEAMEPGFASGFLSRMRPDAASAIFSNLSPEKAYALSVMMAGRNANAATE